MTKSERICAALAASKATSTQLVAAIGGTRPQMTALLLDLEAARRVARCGTAVSRRGPPSIVWVRTESPNP